MQQQEEEKVSLAKNDKVELDLDAYTVSEDITKYYGKDQLPGQSQ